MLFFLYFMFSVKRHRGGVGDTVEENSCISHIQTLQLPSRTCGE